MAAKEQNKEFRLTMTGVPMPLTLKGIWTRFMFFSADGSNAQPIYLGNKLEHANAQELVATLNASNNWAILQPGQETRITDDERYARGTFRRSLFAERGHTHVMSEWYAQGAAGDVLLVNWIAETNEDGSSPYLDTIYQPVGIEEEDLTR
jgi:hypothetical protein